MASKGTYENIERPYDSFLARNSESTIATGGADGVVAGSGTPGDAAGTSSPGGGGNVADTTVKSEQSMADLWIDNTIRSKNWKPKKVGFYINGQTGYAEFSSVFVSGSITVNEGGVIGGWNVGADELYSGNVHLKSTAEQILMGLATAPGTGLGIFMGKDGSDYEFRVGDPAGLYFWWNGSALQMNGPIINNVQSGSDVALLSWQYTALFSPVDNNTIEWSAGTLSFASGAVYSIGAGNTGNMTGATYIYFDSSVSSTELQTTNSSSSAVGGSRIIIAVAFPNANLSKYASFQNFGGTAVAFPQVDTDMIQPNAVDTTEIANEAVQSSKGDIAVRGWNQTSAFSVPTNSEAVELSPVTLTTGAGSGFSIFGGTAASGSETQQAAAQAFTATSTFKLTKVRVTMFKTGSPTDNFYVEIVPDSINGASAARSGESSCASLTTSLAAYDLSFSDGNQMLIESGRTYYLRMHRTGERDTTNRPVWAITATNEYASHEKYLRADMSWSQNGSTSDHQFHVYGIEIETDVVQWTAGTFRASDGTEYAINSGNTPAMTDDTWIHLNINVSLTDYQTTQNYNDAVGDGKVLIAVARPSVGAEAKFHVFGGAGGIKIDAESIVANSITANQIAVQTITAAQIAAGTITADQIAANSITADVIAASTIVANNIAANAITANELSTTLLYAGTITLDTLGNIKGGQTGYDTGTGFFLGYSTSTYKFSIGDSTTDKKVTWDGTNLRANNIDLVTSVIAGETIDDEGFVVYIASGNETLPRFLQDATSNAGLSTSGANWSGQTFVTGSTSRSIESVYLDFTDLDTGDVVTIHLRESSAKGGADIASGTLTIDASTLGSGIRQIYFGVTGENPNQNFAPIEPSTEYFLAVSISNAGGGAPTLRGRSTSAYASGVSYESTDTGANWSTPATGVADFFLITREHYTIPGRVYLATAVDINAIVTAANDITQFPLDAKGNAMLGYTLSGAAKGDTVEVQTAGIFTGTLQVDDPLVAGDVTNKVEPGENYFLTYQIGDAFRGSIQNKRDIADGVNTMVGVGLPARVLSTAETFVEEELVSGNNWVGQSFIATSDIASVKGIGAHWKGLTAATSGSIFYEIRSDNSGEPGALLGQVALDPGDSTNNFGTGNVEYIRLDFSSVINLTPGTTYWVLAWRGNTDSTCRLLGSDTSEYASGAAFVSSNGGTGNPGWSWSAASSVADFAIDIYPKINVQIRFESVETT